MSMTEIVDLRDRPDLPSFLTLGELRIVHVFAERYAAEQDGDESMEVSVYVRDRGRTGGDGRHTLAPWVEFSIGERKFAIWRETLALYEVGPDGAVGEDPIHHP